jgi:acyl carrier protein
MNDDIEKRIKEFIVKSILKQPSRTLTSSEPLISSGLIDSFSLVDLAVYVEDEFGVHIDDSELNSNTFDNMTQLIELINNRI